MGLLPNVVAIDKVPPSWGEEVGPGEDTQKGLVRFNLQLGLPLAGPCLGHNLGVASTCLLTHVKGQRQVLPSLLIDMPFALFAISAVAMRTYWRC